MIPIFDFINEVLIIYWCIYGNILFFHYDECGGVNKDTVIILISLILGYIYMAKCLFYCPCFCFLYLAIAEKQRLETVGA